MTGYLLFLEQISETSSDSRIAAIENCSWMFFAANLIYFAIKVCFDFTINIQCPPKVKVQPVLTLSCFALYSWISKHKDMELR